MSPDRPIRAWARVLENRETAQDTRWLLFDGPEIARLSQPGQFLMFGFGLDNVGAPLLPRPFSVGWRSPEGRIGLLVREFGAGSRRIARLRRGESALLLGPLGTAFQIPPDRPVLCVAGGVGLAPFLFLGDELRRRGAEVRLVYGERSRDRVFDPELIEQLTGVSPEVWTEDGSLGQPGLVTDGLDLGEDPTLLACGPTPMLRAMARLASERGLRLQVSVEEHMSCGMGTCQGCVVPAADGEWVKACTEGPVFESARLRWRA